MKVDMSSTYMSAYLLIVWFEQCKNPRRFSCGYSKDNDIVRCTHVSLFNEDIICSLKNISVNSVKLNKNKHGVDKHV